MLKINKIYENIKAKDFCKDFIGSDSPRYVFGRNEFADSISEQIEIDGFIDDFTVEKEYLGKPIIAIENVPNNALVVIAVTVGKPLLAEKRVKQFQFNSIDYFSFYKYSKLPILEVKFWDGFIEDFNNNRPKYEWIYSKLFDSVSRNQFFNIINFRLSYDLDYMRGFSAIEDKQYFEDFLNLSEKDEVFVDIGAFDGYTTEEFITRCSDYKNIYLFEPEEKNIQIAKKRLEKFQNIDYYQLGLSNKKQTLRFDVSGSSSKITEEGSVTIEVDRLDDLIDNPITFLKMDIEGGEADALEGAKEIIKKYHPKLAISVYHKADDFWKIPEQIFSIRPDYKIYLRHYTEGFAETVMFFIPIKFDQ